MVPQNRTQEELLDLVDQRENVIACLPRSQVYQEKRTNFRAIDVILINDIGQIWVPRRSANKTLMPLYLDSSAAGHVTSGETYDQAFIRELKEELNIDACNIQYTLLGKLTPHQHNTVGFIQIYLIKCNQAPDFNPHDFCEFFWLTPKQIIEKELAGDKVKDNLKILLHFLFKV